MNIGQIAARVFVAALFSAGALFQVIALDRKCGRAVILTGIFLFLGVVSLSVAQA